MSSKFGHQILHFLMLISRPKSEETCRIVSNVNFTSFIFLIIMPSSKKNNDRLKLGNFVIIISVSIFKAIENSNGPRGSLC